jgi:hypothetical protein
MGCGGAPGAGGPDCFAIRVPKAQEVSVGPCMPDRRPLAAVANLQENLSGPPAEGLIRVA